MKRVFISVSYLLLLVISFTYLMIPCVNNTSHTGSETILTAVSFTGLSIIGFLFIIPAFVFTIINLCGPKPIMKFLRDMMTLFASIFVLASVVIALTKGCTSYYAPIILTLCDVVLFVLSLLAVIQSISQDEELKKAVAGNTEKIDVPSNSNSSWPYVAVEPKKETEIKAPELPEAPVVPEPVEVKEDNTENV